MDSSLTSVMMFESPAGVFRSRCPNSSRTQTTQVRLFQGQPPSASERRFPSCCAVDDVMYSVIAPSELAPTASSASNSTPKHVLMSRSDKEPKSKKTAGIEPAKLASALVMSAVRAGPRW